MALDFRYHLASLTAVFAALIIGLLLGVAIADTPGLGRQVDALRRDFQEAKSLRTIDRRTNQFNERTQTRLTQNRLQGRNVALVYSALSLQENTVSSLHNALEAAGATVTVQIALKPSLLTLSQAELAAINPLSIDQPSGELIIDPFLHNLGADLGRNHLDIIAGLAKARTIRISGDPSLPISTVIYLGGGEDTPETIAHIALPFLRGCQGRQLRVAAAEPFDASVSMIQRYKKVSPITIDNIDRAAGRIFLILALANGQQGHFGYKDTAVDGVPDLE